MTAVMMAFAISLTATRDGLEPATIKIESKPVEITDGLTASSESMAMPIERRQME